MNQIVAPHLFREARPHRISAAEFGRMIEAGLFSEARIELVEGELIEMAPSSRPHGMLVARLTARLWNAYGEENWVHFVDTYVGIGPETVRAPDISVVARGDHDADELIGTHVMLAVEVSQTTLREDLQRKRVHYAQAGIRNYWVVDVDGACVHRFAIPRDGDYAEHHENSFDDALPLPGIESVIAVN
jgi:Uma2 family endonuclease